MRSVCQIFEFPGWPHRLTDGQDVPIGDVSDWNITRVF